MVLILGVFLFNLLCGLVPCDPNYGHPVISSKPYHDTDFGDGRPRNKLKIEAKVILSGGSKVEGYHMKTVQGRTIFAFEGIPYGKAERWKSPTPWPGWSGTLKATRRGSDCLQFSAPKYIRVYGEEHCLFVNVFTPHLPYKGHNPGYPVIIYFHSGCFFMGTGSEHGPAYMLDKNLILVTVNYRLGVLGFLSTGDTVLPGNYGLKDQALAIQWVHDNILAFGGDPDNINLMGYSAGGISAHLHMISNRTRHLFRRAISLSGSAFLHWAVQTPERARYYAARVARRFRCPTKNSTELVKCLKKVPVNSLVADQINLFDWFPYPPVLTAPVVEPRHPDAFLVESPEQAYHRGHVADKPWINGFTSHEGLVGILILELFQRWFPLRFDWKVAGKAFLDLTYISTVLGENMTFVENNLDKITEFYIGKNKFPLQGNQFQFGAMITHRFFHFGIFKALQAHASIAPTYAYYFSFREGRYSMGNMYGHRSSEWAPGHGEDEFYWFNTSNIHPGFAKTDPDYKMSAVMINMLTNFVTTGKPTYTTDEGDTIDVWDQITPPPSKSSPTNKTVFRMLQWAKEVKMIDYPEMDKLKFWQDLKLKDMIPWVPIIS